MPIITPIGAPAIQQPQGASSVQRAIEAFNKSAATSNNQPIVQNQNQVSPEELGAIKAPSESRQNNTNEESVSEKPVETKAPEDPLSSQYAIFARKEKAQRLRDQQLRAREEALKAKELALTSPAQQAIDTSKFVNKDELTKNPLQVLSELGLSYDQLTNLALSAPSEQEIARKQYETKIEAEIKSIKDAQEANKKFIEEQQTQSYQQAVRQIKFDASQFIESSPEFEAIRATNSINDVVELIEQTFKEENRLLSVEEASKAVEDYLVEEAMKLTKLNKIQQRLRPVQTALTKQEPTKQNQTLKTLTNSVSSTRPLTAKERAILAFKGELK